MASKGIIVSIAVYSQWRISFFPTTTEAAIANLKSNSKPNAIEITQLLTAEIGITDNQTQLNTIYARGCIPKLFLVTVTMKVVRNTVE